MNRYTSYIALLTALLAFTAGCDSPAEANGDENEGEQAEAQQAEVEQQQRLTVEQLDEETRQQALTDPTLVEDRAPEEFHVQFQSTKGEFTIAVHRRWAPNGADRLYNLARIGYFEDVAFFRVVDGFMVQFGLHGQPEVNQAWRAAQIPDDEVQRSNTRGKVTYAMAGPDTRTTQIFINYGDNSQLDGDGFAPIGEVIDGMDVVDSLYSGYGDGPPMGRGPDQGRIQQQGNDYLREQFENLDYIESVTVTHP